MARSYAQLAAVVFFVTGLVGLVAGQPSHHLGLHGAGQPIGSWADFDGVALHLTYVRDALNLVIAGVFAYAGWRAPNRDAALIALGAGAFLLALAVIGFIVSDDDLLAGGHHPSVAGLRFPLAINIFDLVTGVLGVLSGLGGLEEEEAAPA
ncbi:MAG: hypothetical protein E6J45_08060 [Chloroflexi bacterium]|nr:MAG: hypothetical protein E6J45_08060 [Chloroflexota bacterium]